MENILITGATGNIGTSLTQILTSQNVPFTQSVSDQNLANKDEGKVFVDFNDRQTMRSAFSNIKTLFLLFPMVEPMVDFAKNAVDVAKEVGVKHIVRSSGYGSNFKSEYLMAHIQGSIDEYIKASGLNYTITRPTNFMQNFINSFAHDIKQGTIYSAAGNGKMAFIDVEDIAKVNAEILKNPEYHINQEYDLTGDELLTFNEAVEKIGTVINKEIKVIEVSLEQSEQSMLQMGFPKFIVDMLISLNSQIRVGDFNSTTKTVYEITGHNPNTFDHFVANNKLKWL